MTVLNMDCVAGMRLFPDNSFDSIVCDPPYELTSARPGGRSPATEGKVMKGFMGMTWDGSGIAYSVEMWAEALRVLKPGGHMFAFGGTRTYHRMVCAIEDAGFDIRDQFGWAYGSGFPKSRDIAKLDMTGQDAEDWDGWGTAVKPAWEPICLARKPLAKGLTVAANVLTFGTGALNIEACRVVGDDKPVPFGKPSQAEGWRLNKRETNWQPSDVGRWPANIIHDGSDEVLAAFPDAKGQQGALSGNEPSPRTRAGLIYGTMDRGHESTPRIELDKSAARFFYCAKASKADRDEGLDDFEAVTVGDGRTVAADNAFQRGKTERQNIHPTVKPNALMRYLVRLITPPGGVVMDHFTGSGSTGKAAKQEGFGFIGFEQDATYARIANARIDAAQILVDGLVNSA